ncbi:MAG TPA: methanogenesis marker 3 protein [Methanobacterium sp.]|nr:methanogenesis marker 3 protein [Methanobacterium sp.]
MQVKINGEKIDLPEGSTIQDAIDASGAPYYEGCVLGLIKGTEEVEQYVNKYSLKTTKGSIIIELLPDAPEEIKDTWKKRYREFENLRIRWTTSNDVAIGPIKTNMEPTHDEHQYQRWDVVLSLSGFTAEATHIILIKDKSKSVYGVPEIGNNHNGVFAQVVGGKRTVMKLEDQDDILKVRPVLERKSIVKSAAITDPETEINDGNEIFTYVKVKLSEKSPQSAEHFFALSEEEKMKIDYESDSFVGFYGLQGLETPAEHLDQRRRGTITLRNTGKGTGRVYIYREDRVSTPSHSLVGKVENGIQLLDIAGEGDQVTFKTEPQRIMALALTQKKAQELLERNGVEQIREGLTDDDAVVVVQEPRYTMDILGKNKVKTFGIREENLIYLDIYDQAAPRSSWYFKKITGLLDSPVGSLKIQFSYPGTKVMMFQGSSRDSKGLIPENTPEDKVEKGEVALTNMSKRNIGVLGVRFEDNKEFGPTGEPFKATNIFGKVVKGIENLEKFKEGETVYVTRKKS